VVIHALNAMLLFLLLRWATGAVGRSFVAAALFAWHPFNVQSVAWVAERKNVLSSLFVLLAIGAYGWYARQPQVRRFAVAAGFFIAALASKPMAVTLPFLLLLLDYWPLQRVKGWRPTSPEFPVPQQSPRRLLLEKLPPFVLSAASCVVTVWAQKAGGALQPLQGLTFYLRLKNALWSYGVYLGKTFWPSRFSVLYPHPGASLPLWKPLVAVAFLCAFSIAAWSQRNKRPYLLVGWLWFLGALVPVIGFVQVGDQAMADRYAYLPLIGIFVMVVWGAAEFYDWVRLGPTLGWASAAASLAILAALTFHELGFWKDSVTLWSHALQVTNGNPLIEKYLGNSLFQLGKLQEARVHLLQAEQAEPQNVVVHINLGVSYLANSQTQEAEQQFESVIKLTDDPKVGPEDMQFRPSAFLDLGIAYALANDFPNALANIEQATQSGQARIDNFITKVQVSVSMNHSEDGVVKLALGLWAEGRKAEASSMLQDAVNANPEYNRARQLLSYLNSDPK